MTQTQTDWLSRLIALAIALGAWVGLGITLEGQVVKFGSFFVSLWVLSGYFTILTNFLVAVVFTVLALGGRHSIHPRFLAGVMLAIVLVGVVYGVLLRGLQELTGVELISNMLLHQLIPLLVPIYWFSSPQSSRFAGPIQRSGPSIRWSISSMPWPAASPKGTSPIPSSMSAPTARPRSPSPFSLSPHCSSSSASASSGSIAGLVQVQIPRA